MHATSIATTSQTGAPSGAPGRHSGWAGAPGQSDGAFGAAVERAIGPPSDRRSRAGGSPGIDDLSDGPVHRSEDAGAEEGGATDPAALVVAVGPMASGLPLAVRPVTGAGDAGGAIDGPGEAATSAGVGAETSPVGDVRQGGAGQGSATASKTDAAAPAGESMIPADRGVDGVPARGAEAPTATVPQTAAPEEAKQPASPAVGGELEVSTERPVLFAARALHRALGLEDVTNLSSASESGEEASGDPTVAVAKVDGNPNITVGAVDASLDSQQGQARGQDVSGAGSSNSGVVALGASVGPGQMARAAEAAAPQALGAPGSTEGAVLPQIVQAMRVQMRNGVGEARVQLNPEHLGAVTVALRIENGQVSAAITAETPEVRRWLDNHQSVLRDALADLGLELSRFVVNPDAGSSDHEQHEPEASPRRRPGLRSAERGSVRFEVLV